MKSAADLPSRFRKGRYVQGKRNLLRGKLMNEGEACVVISRPETMCILCISYCVQSESESSKSLLGYAYKLVHSQIFHARASKDWRAGIRKCDRYVLFASLLMLSCLAAFLAAVHIKPALWGVVSLPKNLFCKSSYFCTCLPIDEDALIAGFKGRFLRASRLKSHFVRICRAVVNKLERKRVHDRFDEGSCVALYVGGATRTLRVHPVSMSHLAIASGELHESFLDLRWSQHSSAYIDGGYDMRSHVVFSVLPFCVLEVCYSILVSVPNAEGSNRQDQVGISSVHVGLEVIHKKASKS